MRIHSLLAGLLVCILLPVVTMAGEPQYSLETYDASRSAGGTTVFMETMSPKKPRLVEIDMEGKVVWEYAIPKNIARKGNCGNGADVEWIAKTDTILFVMPFAGIYEVNRAGEIVWKHETKRVTHDADRLPNGNTIHAFGWDARNETQIKEVDPKGNLVWSWSAADHIDASERRTESSVKRDGFTHNNSVERLENGNTRVSLRNFNMVLDIAPSGEIVRTVRELPNGREIRNPHEPKEMPDGNLLVSMHGPQILFELSPEGRVVRKLKDKKIHLVRGHQLLPNGNLLLTDVNKILELSPQWEIVWSVSKPIPWVGKTSPGSPGDPRTRGFYKAVRIPPR